jgi:hypothetical protein
LDQSVEKTTSGSVVPAPPNVNQTTWGQPYGTHYTNNVTDEELNAYFIDLRTGYPIDPYTDKKMNFDHVMPRWVIDAVHD